MLNAEAVVGSGHAAVGIGSLVVKVGGLRPQCPLDCLDSSRAHFSFSVKLRAHTMCNVGVLKKAWGVAV